MPELFTEATQPLGSGQLFAANSVRDRSLATQIHTYKASVAGAYASVAPDAITTRIPEGEHLVSTKLDGEQWFLYKNGSGSLLLSPKGRAITGIPLTEEADRSLASFSGLLAGELYAAPSEHARARVFNLHAALSGGVDAPVNKLRFAAFDLLRDSGTNASAQPFAARAKRIQALLPEVGMLHAVDFSGVRGPKETSAFFQRRVDAGAEGVVMRCEDGRVFKIKPEISLDAAVVAWTEGASGLGELLLALQPDAENPKSFQLIGRLDIGFTREQRRQLAECLRPLQEPASIALSSRSGLPYTWLRPELVVEVRCHELLSQRGNNEAIRRWRVSHEAEGWRAMGKAASVSMRDAVFVRMREEKSVTPHDVRWTQVTDLVPGLCRATPAQVLPTSTLLRREVYGKSIQGALAIRKCVVWKTNKESSDPRYPPYAAIFTDYSPSRAEPLCTELRVATTQEVLLTFIDDWRMEKIRSGWKALANSGQLTDAVKNARKASSEAHGGSHTLTIAFARSTSPTFPIVRRRLDALAALGSLEVTKDEAGKEVWFELRISAGLVDAYRRILNLLNLVRRWKSVEFSLNEEALDRFATDSVLNRLEEIRQCWIRHKAGGAAGCTRNTTLGCRMLHLTPSLRLLTGSQRYEPPWWTVGRFESGCVQIDKTALEAQCARQANRLLEECPCYNSRRIKEAIATLPDRLESGDAQYRMAYCRDTGLTAWLWPTHALLPPRLTERGAGHQAQGGTGESGTWETSGAAPSTTPPQRTLPPTTYADVCGQDYAVQALRDLIELPMRHAERFAAIGATAHPAGVILAGPPGTGKTLLARALAAECHAHLEIISGPELLNPYVGATEEALRKIFNRAQRHVPALLLFDELDGLAPARAGANAHHERAVVAQLLALLDGLEGRGKLFILATTNRPEAIDPALRRPGRFDRVVWMRPPNRRGRAAILERYLTPLRLEKGLDVQTLARQLAQQTKGASGADLAYLCQSAARICVKQQLKHEAQGGPTPHVCAIALEHFQQAVRESSASK